MLVKSLTQYVETGMQQAMPKQKSDALKRLVEHVTYRNGNSGFLIGILSTLHAKEDIRCEIFTKSYSYVGGMYDMCDSDNEDNFYYHSGGMKRSE